MIANPSSLINRPLGAVTGNSIIIRALSILRSYGTNAHVYLPGIGTINGLTAGNYLESTGNTVATVDGLVGLAKDALGGIGPELVTNGDFSSATGWTLGQPTSGSVTIAGGVLNITSLDGSACFARTGNIYTAGKTYQITFDVVSITGTLRVDAGGVIVSTTITTAGAKTFTFTATASTTLSLIRAGVVNATIDNVSSKEITGIHATQATTANKPILRQVSGKYSWEFDGTNDSLALGSVPFQMADDHCVIAAFKVNTVAAGSKVISSIYGAGTQRVAQLSVETDTLTATWTDDAGTAGTSPTGSVITAGTNLVACARKTGNTKELFKNDVLVNASTTAAGATTVTTAAIGTNGTGFHNGNLSIEIKIKGTVSDADKTILSKYAAQYAGVTL